MLQMSALMISVRCDTLCAATALHMCQVPGPEFAEKYLQFSLSSPGSSSLVSGVLPWLDWTGCGQSVDESLNPASDEKTRNSFCLVDEMAKDKMELTVEKAEEDYGAAQYKTQGML